MRFTLSLLSALAIFAGVSILSFTRSPRADERAEEAGVNAALAFRQARDDFQRQHGRPPNTTELLEMGETYKAELLKLGYDTMTFRRTRSHVAEEAYALHAIHEIMAFALFVCAAVFIAGAAIVGAVDRVPAKIRQPQNV
jgi:hypothetical protein